MRVAAQMGIIAFIKIDKLQEDKCGERWGVTKFADSFNLTRSIKNDKEVKRIYVLPEKTKNMKKIFFCEVNVLSRLRLDRSNYTNRQLGEACLSQFS